MVGSSRIGKSSAWNWLMGHKLIGRIDPKDEFNTIYEVNTHNSGQAVIGQDPDTSLTTIPNIGRVGKDTMLLDMAGFNDTGRSHAEVLIVSYMLKRCL